MSIRQIIREELQKIFEADYYDRYPDFLDPQFNPQMGAYPPVGMHAYGTMVKEEETDGKMIGYKVMRYEDGKLISGANSSLTFEPKIGEYMRMPGQGIFISPIKDYVLDYYSGLNDSEALLTFEFDPKDIKFGELTDKEPEVGVSRAKLIDFEILDDE